jgi:hypothetical protein
LSATIQVGETGTAAADEKEVEPEEDNAIQNNVTGNVSGGAVRTLDEVIIKENQPIDFYANYRTLESAKNNIGDEFGWKRASCRLIPNSGTNSYNQGTLQVQPLESLKGRDAFAAFNITVDKIRDLSRDDIKNISITSMTKRCANKAGMIVEWTNKDAIVEHDANTPLLDKQTQKFLFGVCDGLEDKFTNSKYADIKHKNLISPKHTKGQLIFIFKHQYQRNQSYFS